MADKNIVHLKEGGKVIIDGDRVELHLTGPLTFHRSHWVHYLTPSEEARRAFTYGGPERALTAKLAEAFTAVPMIVYKDSSDD